MGQTQTTFDASSEISMRTFVNGLIQMNEADVTDDLLISNLTKAVIALKEKNENEYADSKTMPLLLILLSLTKRSKTEKALEIMIKEGLHLAYSNMIEYYLKQTKLDCTTLIVIFGSLGNLTYHIPKSASYNIKYNIHKKALAVLNRINISELTTEEQSYNIFTYFFQGSSTSTIENNQLFGLFKNLINFFYATSVQKETIDALVEIGMVDVLIEQEKRIKNVKNLRKEFKYVQSSVVATIANLLTDQELDTLPISDEISQTSIEALDEIVKNFKINQKIINNTKYYTSYSINYGTQSLTTTMYCAEHLNILISIAVNDTIKRKLFEGKIIPLLEDILKNGNEDELEKSVELIVSLCFCENIAAFIRDNERLMLQLTHVQDKSNNETTKRSCQQIRHLVTNRSVEPQISQSDQKGHIMLSYNHKYKEECLKINAELRIKEYNTWMDVNSVFNDLHEAMAQAIENASVVLVCYSREYKISNNCRLEAQYAVKLNKPIIAVKLQSNYDPDGWLGMILASKLYVDFSNNVSSMTFKSLCNQIDSLLAKPDDTLQEQVNHLDAAFTNTIQLTQTVEDQDNPIKWSTEDVKNWLTNNNMSTLVSVFKTCRGLTLKSLWDMQKRNYDQFCLTVEKEIEKSNQDVDTFEKLTFYQLLQTLF